MPQDTNESESKQRLSLWGAVSLVRKRLEVSVGAAQGALCEACASGMVRWHRGDWRYAIPISTATYPLTREVWGGAHIDLDEGEVVHGRNHYSVEINGDDLTYWLSVRRSSRVLVENQTVVRSNGSGSSLETPSAGSGRLSNADSTEPYLTLGEALECSWEENKIASGEKSLEWLTDRCACGHIRVRGRRLIYASNQPLNLGRMELVWFALEWGRARDVVEPISQTEWNDLIFFMLEEPPGPITALFSKSMHRLAWLDLTLCRPDIIRELSVANQPRPMTIVEPKGAVDDAHRVPVEVTVSKSRRGPKPGTLDRFGQGDRALFPEVERLVGQGLSITAATVKLAAEGKVAGSGIPESRAKRLADRYRREFLSAH
jgi:hypothetical protein